MRIATVTEMMQD